MQNRFIGSILMIVAVLAFSPGLLAQTPAGPAGAKSTPDLSGVWIQGGVIGGSPGAGAEANARDITAGRVPRFGFSVEEPPMQPWAAERYKAARGDIRNESNSTLYPYCLPEGFPRIYTISAFEVVQAPGRVYMLFERNHQVRRIFTDGRKHLEGWIPSFMGISHGRWDGETLVVETSNILSLDRFAWLDTFGHPFTDALRIVERIRRVDHDTLEDTLTFDDPKAYTKPWTGQKIYKLKPNWVLIENVCTDNLENNKILKSFVK